MAKALKIAAVVVGVAALAVVTGGAALGLGVSLATTLTVGGAYISAGALLLGAGALAAGASLLAKRPGVTASQTDRLNVNIDPGTFRKTVLGQTAMPVDVRYEEFSGSNQEYCDWIVALASHSIDGVEEIWLNTEMAWSATTGTVGKYVGYFSVPNIVLEGTPANAFTFATGKWNAASAHLTGCPYLRMRFKLTGNGKKAESPFSGGIPSRITIIGRGAKLYDPRRDSTVPGGSGPMRWNDQSTWRYTADDGAVIGENLPLHVLRVLLGWRIRNPVTGEMRLATGSGVPGKRIDFASFQVAANIADELVNRSAGGNEPRFHGAAVISEGDDPKTILDMLCAACCGRFRDTNGKLSFVIAHNDLAAASLDDGLNDDDVVGAFSWDPDPSLEATPNVVRGKYVDASTSSLYQLIDYPEVRLPSPDGQDRILPMDLGAVESPSQAQRIAKQVLQRRQYAREFTAPFDIRAWKYAVGDVVPFTFAALGFSRVIFRVKEQELGQDGVCNMTLTYETPIFYQWDADDARPVQAAEPIVYDSLNNPLILAIDEAAGTALWDGVTGAGRPDDNADVTGDNTSKDTNAVGGKPSSEFLAELAAAQAYQENLTNNIIPAINAAAADADTRIDAVAKEASDAVADARQRLDAAVSDLATEVARAQGADEELVRRIDSIVANGAGYDDTSVRALIERADTARADGDRALAESIDRVVTSYTDLNTATNTRIEDTARGLASATAAVGERVNAIESGFTSGGGNLLSNTDFVTTDGWTENRSMPRPFYGINAAGDLYHPVGENVLSIFQSGRAGGDDSYADWVSDPVAVVGGSFVQFSAMFASHRADTQAFLAWVDTNGVIFAFVNGNRNSSTDQYAVDPNLYKRSGVVSVEVPLRAVAVRLFMRKNDTYEGQSDSYAWFWRPYVGAARQGQNSWNDWSPGGARAVQVASDARVESKFTTLADADRAIGQRVDSVVADYQAGDRNTNARVDSQATALADAKQALGQQIETVSASIGPAVNAKAEEITTAYTTADTALGRRATSLEAQASPSGGNLVPNSALSTLDGWRTTENRDQAGAVARNAPSTDFQLGGVENNLTLFRGSAGTGSLVSGLPEIEVQSAPFAVRPDSTLQFYALTASHRSRAWTALFFFDGDDRFIGTSGSDSVGARINAGGQNLNEWDITGRQTVVVPINATKARFVARQYDVSNDGYADPTGRALHL